MLPGVMASSGFKRKSSAPVFKGVATYTGGLIEVFQDTGTSYDLIFSESDSSVREIHLGATDLLVCRTTSPYLRVYSWTGSTLAQSWEMSPTLFNNAIPGSACISYDGNRIHYGTLGGSSPYAQAGIGILGRGGNGAYTVQSYVNTTTNVASSATNSDGTQLFANRGSNTTAGFSRLISGTTWSTFAGTGSAPFGNSQPSAMSRVQNNGNGQLYAATLSTSSPYIVIYRTVMSTGGVFRLSNVSSIPPSTYALQAVDVSYDGSYVCVGYQAGTTANGNIRIYGKSTDTAFNTLAYDPGSAINGRIVGVSFNQDSTKLFAARAYTGVVTDRVWVYTRNGTAWSQTGSINTNSNFSPSDTAVKLISAN